MPLILSGDTGVPASGMPTGSVIQTVNATTTTQKIITGGTYEDTNLTATITPTSTTSKILVIVMQAYRVYANSGNPAYTWAGIQLVRNGTAILLPVADNSGAYQLGSQSTTTNQPQSRGIYSCNFLDSPATISAVTYKTQAKRYDSNSAIILQENDNVSNNMSVITLMEIKG